MEFCRIFRPGDSRKENSAEFFVPDTPGKKILQNFSSQTLRDEKFCRIPLFGLFVEENPLGFCINNSPICLLVSNMSK
jgi:hypothetical protein